MAFHGVDFYIEQETAPGTYKRVACAQSTDFTINAAPIDVTGDCSNKWRSFIEAGVMSVDANASGVSEDDGFITTILSGTAIGPYKITLATGGSLTGNFALASYNTTRTHDGAVAFSISLQSSGPIVYAAS